MADVMKIAAAILLSLVGAFLIIRFFTKHGDGDERVIGLVLGYGWVMAVLFFFFAKV